MRIDGVFLFIGVGAVAKTELIKIGVAGRAHGVRGAVRVFMDDEGSDSLLHVREVYLGPEHRRYDVRRAVRCGRFMALELEDITDRVTRITPAIWPAASWWTRRVGRGGLSSESCPTVPRICWNTDAKTERRGMSLLCRRMSARSIWKAGR